MRAMSGSLETAETVTAESFDSVMHLHVRAAMFGMKYAVPIMREAGRRFDHLDGVDRRLAERLRAAALFDRQGRDHAYDEGRGGAARAARTFASIAFARG